MEVVKVTIDLVLATVMLILAGQGIHGFNTASTMVELIRGLVFTIVGIGATILFFKNAFRGEWPWE